MSVIRTILSSVYCSILLILRCIVYGPSADGVMTWKYLIPVIQIFNCLNAYMLYLFPLPHSCKTRSCTFAWLHYSVLQKNLIFFFHNTCKNCLIFLRSQISIYIKQNLLRLFFSFIHCWTNLYKRILLYALKNR